MGSGSSREKRLVIGGDTGWGSLTTVDINPDHKPDLVLDLEQTPYPWDDDTFDEVHAYELLEHLGDQGDYHKFFAQFSEIYRILKPGGTLAASVPAPNSPWVWGDPSHRRAILPETLVFLNQEEYTRQVGVTAMSDFRYIYKADFQTLFANIEDDQFYFALKAIKPSRIQLDKLLDI